MGIIGMDTLDIECNNCDGRITEYYHDGYRGRRGKCSKCNTDFPLE